MYFFLFFPHKSPHFLWGLSSRTDRSLPQFQRWWPQPWWLNDLRKVATLYLYCGSSDSCSNSRYGAWHAHAHGRHPHPTSPKITTNTPIHPIHPSAISLSLTLPSPCVCACVCFCGMLVKVPCNCLTLDPGPIWITFQRIKADPGWSVWSSDTWTKADPRSVILWTFLWVLGVNVHEPVGPLSSAQLCMTPSVHFIRPVKCVSLAS